MENQEPLTLCTNGCGFFGSSDTNNMCSICHKQAKQAAVVVCPPSTLKTSQSSEKATNTDEIPIIDPAPIQSIITESDQKEIDIKSSENFTVNDENVEVKLKDISSSDLISVTPSESLKRKKSSESLDSENANCVTDADCNHWRSSSSSSRASSASKIVSRCMECKKRVGLTGYTCRCEGTFCGLHRYSDVHKCQFDYKSMATEEIKKNNPIVRGDKIRKL